MHGIEQIPYINEIFFENLLNLKNNFKFIHFEPIGWQISQSKSIEGSFEKYALEDDYNRNLFELVSFLESKKLIKITEILKDYICINLENGTSLLSWEPYNS